GQRVQQRRLAGVGIADDRRRFELGAAPAGALLPALHADLRDLTIQVTHAFANPPALDFDLLLAEPASRPHSPTPPADLPVVRVGADQAGQQVVQPRRFDLEAALVSTGVLGEDLEDDLGAIEDTRLDRQLQVALLARAQVFVGDDEVIAPFELELAKRVHLAHTDQVRRVDL